MRISGRGYKLVAKPERRKGFTLIELLVVVSIISLLIAILLPALGKVREQGRKLRCMNNLRQIAAAVNCFAMDNDERYPESTATITFGTGWRWQEPMMMTAVKNRSGQKHRSMSAYLGSYIRDASIVYCPSAPMKYKYFQQAWEAGDNWVNPKAVSAPGPDSLSGTYCFYWNYTGFLEGRQQPFRGPRNPFGGRGQSKLLVTDYLGLGHWRNKQAYSSCDAYGSSEKFNGANVTPGTCVSSAFWSRLKSDSNVSLDRLNIRLHASYTDGRVESFWPGQTLPMRVSLTTDGGVPYPAGISGDPGVFYLPRNGLY